MIQQELLLSFHDCSYLSFATKTHSKHSNRVRRHKDLSYSPPIITPLISRRSMAIRGTERASSLPGLPPELRERIYSELLQIQPASLFHLLTVNRRISNEVQPWIFRQPIIFNGQQSLFRWLSRTDPGFLPYVRTIVFTLHDIDPEQIVGTLGERLRRARVYKDTRDYGNPYQEECSLELRHVLTALKAFKCLNDLTILEATSADPRPPIALVEGFADIFIQELPLVSLSVPHKAIFWSSNRSNKIHRLRLTSYSLVGSIGFPRDPARFSQVSTLQICGAKWSEMPVYLDKHDTPIYIFEKTSKLQELIMCFHEVDERYPRRIETYAAFEVHIMALTEMALPLKTFRLWCNNSPIDRNSHEVQTFLRFLKDSSLTHIDTGYWWSPSPNEYPNSIATITVRFDSNYPILHSWMHKFLGAIRSKDTKFFVNHPDLREISLHLPLQAQDIPKELDTRRLTVNAMCENHGIKFRVIHEDFVCHRHK